MPANSQRHKLFVATCIERLLTSISFGIRAGLPGAGKHKSGPSQKPAGIKTVTAFPRFPYAVNMGGKMVDLIETKKLPDSTLVVFTPGIILTIADTGSWPAAIVAALNGAKNTSKNATDPGIIFATLIMPFALILAFTILFVYGLR